MDAMVQAKIRGSTVLALAVKQVNPFKFLKPRVEGRLLPPPNDPLWNHRLWQEFVYWPWTDWQLRRYLEDEWPLRPAQIVRWKRGDSIFSTLEYRPHWIQETLLDGKCWHPGWVVSLGGGDGTS